MFSAPRGGCSGRISVFAGEPGSRDDLGDLEKAFGVPLSGSNRGDGRDAGGGWRGEGFVHLKAVVIIGHERPPHKSTEVALVGDVLRLANVVHVHSVFTSRVCNNRQNVLS